MPVDNKDTKPAAKPARNTAAEVPNAAVGGVNEPHVVNRVADRVAELSEREFDAKQDELDKDSTYQQAERVTVKSGYIGTPDEDRVAFSDTNEVHGAKGAYVVGTEEFEVAITPEVLDAVRHGRLVVTEFEGQVDAKVKELSGAGLSPSLASATAKELVGAEAARLLNERLEGKEWTAEGDAPSNPAPGQVSGAA